LQNIDIVFESIDKSRGANFTHIMYNTQNSEFDFIFEF